MPLFKRSHALFRNAALLLTLTYLYGCASRTSADSVQAGAAPATAPSAR